MGWDGGGFKSMPYISKLILITWIIKHFLRTDRTEPSFPVIHNQS